MTEEKKIFTGEELLDDWFKHIVKTDICDCEDCKKIHEMVIECLDCGYKGTGFYPLECCCYDEWAVGCTPRSPGPGCPHGNPICPVCENGDYSIIDSFKSLRNLLRTKKYQEIFTSLQRRSDLVKESLEEMKTEKEDLK